MKAVIVPSKRATFDDLYRVEGKAELVGGRIVHYMASGYEPSVIAFEIAVRCATMRGSEGLDRHLRTALALP
jgi:hypothetical protein